MKPRGWGLCCECARKPATGRCRDWGACYFGGGSVNDRGLWEARKAPVVDASPVLAVSMSEGPTKSGAWGEMTLTDGDGNETVIPFEAGDLSWTPATCGDCAGFDAGNPSPEGTHAWCGPQKFWCHPNSTLTKACRHAAPRPTVVAVTRDKGAGSALRGLCEYCGVPHDFITHRCRMGETCRWALGEGCYDHWRPKDA